MIRCWKSEMKENVQTRKLNIRVLITLNKMEDAEKNKIYFLK